MDKAAKTPGVYIVEKNAFPDSVVEVGTAVPAFVGYTEKAANGAKSLRNLPWKVSSLNEFHAYFGGAPQLGFTITQEQRQTPVRLGEKCLDVARVDKFSLYHGLLLFYMNGGGSCYIVSVGDYAEGNIQAQKLEEGITSLAKEREPTLLVIPEAVALSGEACSSLQRAMLKHCGEVMRNRFALLDIFNGSKARNDPEAGDVVARFRESIGSEFLDFGAAYYPWLNTTIVQERELSFENLDIDALKALLLEEADKSTSLAEKEKAFAFERIGAVRRGLSEADSAGLHNILQQLSPLYRDLLKEMHSRVNLFPPSAAMAGIYTMVDNTKGVWKAPANVGVAAAVSPAVNISHQDQEDLNVPQSGKAINAIRVFVGEGIKIWGARTLDGNSLDWRYVNVRRTMIMIEESIKNAVRAYIFEPNAASTWVNIKCAIERFLSGIWKRGGLAGATPEDAYSVHVGLGATMTPEDILEGILRVTVLVAQVRPAEFIEITFEQPMLES